MNATYTPSTTRNLHGWIRGTYADRRVTEDGRIFFIQVDTDHTHNLFVQRIVGHYPDGAERTTPGVLIGGYSTNADARRAADARI